MMSRGMDGPVRVPVLPSIPLDVIKLNMSMNNLSKQILHYITASGNSTDTVSENATKITEWHWGQRCTHCSKVT